MATDGYHRGDGVSENGPFFPSSSRARIFQPKGKPLNEFALNFSFFLFALIFHRRCSGRQKKINNKARYRKKVNRYSHTSAGRPGKQSK